MIRFLPQNTEVAINLLETIPSNHIWTHLLHHIGLNDRHRLDLIILMGRSQTGKRGLWPLPLIKRVFCRQIGNFYCRLTHPNSQWPFCMGDQHNYACWHFFQPTCLQICFEAPFKIQRRPCNPLAVLTLSKASSAHLECVSSRSRFAPFGFFHLGIEQSDAADPSCFCPFLSVTTSGCLRLITTILVNRHRLRHL